MSCVWQDLKINIYLIVNLAVFGLVRKNSAKTSRINLSLFFVCLCGRVEVLLESYLFQAKQTKFMVDKNALPFYGLTHWGPLSHHCINNSINLKSKLTDCFQYVWTIFWHWLTLKFFNWCLMYMVDGALLKHFVRVNINLFTEFFLVRIFLHSDWITPYLKNSVFANFSRSDCLLIMLLPFPNRPVFQRSLLMHFIENIGFRTVTVLLLLSFESWIILF